MAKVKKVVRKSIWTKAPTFIGVKLVNAVAMTLGEYNKVRGWTIPDDEDPKAPGYMTKDPDIYITWCPKAQFEEANTPSTGMPFGHAIEAMKKGLKVQRAGWNGKGMWCIYVPGTKKAELRPGTPYAKVLGKRKFIEILPHFDMYTVNAEGRKAMLPGWAASQSDMDACDWQVV